MRRTTAVPRRRIPRRADGQRGRLRVFALPRHELKVEHLYVTFERLLYGVLDFTATTTPDGKCVFCHDTKVKNLAGLAQRTC